MDVKFVIPKMSDREILNKMLEAFSQFDYLKKLDIKVEFSSEIRGKHYNPIVIWNFSEELEINEILNRNIQCFKTIKFNLESNTYFHIARTNDNLISDDAHLSYQDNFPANSLYQLDQLLAETMKNLGTFNPNLISSAVISEDLQKYYSQREETQTMLQKVTAELLNNTANFRLNLDHEYSVKQDLLQERHNDLTSKLAAEHNNKLNILDKKYQDMIVEKENELKAKIEAYEKKKAEIDDRDNTHVRRELRESLKTIISSRAKEFNLTGNTIKKRNSVFWTSVFTMFFFALLTTWGFYELSINTTGTLDIALIIRSLFSSLAFGATLIFFLKWNNQWFQQHANEEFRLKRMELDIDRASWVVEMAMEWKKEKGTEIPEELLQRLTANLFAEDKMYYDNLHPADNLASALLGASSNIKFNTPNAQFEMDRKGLKNLEKQ